MGDAQVSFGYSNPSLAAGDIQNIRSAASSLSLFRTLFIPNDAPSSKHTFIVDRVMESYRSLRNGNRRLSTDDRRRLDDHMDRLAELQRKLNTEFPAACAGVDTPLDDSLLLIDSEETYAGLLYNQFLATVLQAMGLTPREFELWGHRGYGLAAVEPPGTNLPLQSTTKTPQAATFKSPATYCPSLAEPSTAP